MTSIDEGQKAGSSIDDVLAKARELDARRVLLKAGPGERSMSEWLSAMDGVDRDLAALSRQSLLSLCDEVERLRAELLAARACAESGEMLRDRVLERRDTIDDYTEFATKLAQWRATREAK